MARYTTIIDISEAPLLYRNVNARLLYLHMVLRCGYTDNDRDLYTISMRRTAQEVGITYSALRCALNALTRYGLVTAQGNGYLVKKFLAKKEISPRAKTEQKERTAKVRQIDREEHEARAEAMKTEETKRLALRATGKTTFMLYVEELKRKAEQGDMEALEAYNRHKSTYERHKATIHQEQQEQPKQVTRP